MRLQTTNIEEEDHDGKMITLMYRTRMLWASSLCDVVHLLRLYLVRTYVAMVGRGKAKGGKARGMMLSTGG